MTAATVKLWGTPVGYVAMATDERHGRFSYDPDFAEAGIELAPLTMPVDPTSIWRFDDLPIRSFHGLPGLLADSLPDRYGNSIIDAWLARTGRSPGDFNAVDRLCATGVRGMGALEFEPAMDVEPGIDKELQVAALVELAGIAFAAKESLESRLGPGSSEGEILDILRVGTSAGGARAKAVIAFHPKTGEVRSGQVDLRPGFEHWLIKFDGVRMNGDWGVADPAGYGLLEFTYSQIAKRCGIEMSECRVLEENGRHHFMTRRFDRGPDGSKRFMQTFAALAHFDYYESGHHSYEELFFTMKKLGMGVPELEQQFRRMVFNLVGCNQDDHVKNFAFLMDRRGRWSLTPAYDLCHAEGSAFTARHQLQVNGKTTDFDRADLKAAARYAGLPQGRDGRILEEVCDHFASWEDLAQDVGVPSGLRDHVLRTLRLDWT